MGEGIHPRQSTAAHKVEPLFGPLTFCRYRPTKFIHDSSHPTRTNNKAVDGRITTTLVLK